jgi:hypothetical protein
MSEPSWSGTLELINIPGRGDTFIAKRRIEEGEVILRETPALLSYAASELPPIAAFAGADI